MQLHCAHTIALPPPSGNIMQCTGHNLSKGTRSSNQLALALNAILLHYGNRRKRTSRWDDSHPCDRGTPCARTVRWSQGPPCALATLRCRRSCLAGGAPYPPLDTRDTASAALLASGPLRNVEQWGSACSNNFSWSRVSRTAACSQRDWLPSTVHA